VAEAIAGALAHPRREIYVGTVARPMVALSSLAPSALVDAVTASIIERKHFQDRPVEASTGNLFAPMPQYAMVDGGWSKPAHARRARAVALSGVLLAGIGLALLAVQAPRRRRRLSFSR
jgi:hypothetical protein